MPVQTSAVINIVRSMQSPMRSLLENFDARSGMAGPQIEIISWQYFALQR